jgi:hypothetical protein
MLRPCERSEEADADIRRAMPCCVRSAAVYSMGRRRLRSRTFPVRMYWLLGLFRSFLSDRAGSSRQLQKIEILQKQITKELYH